MEKTITSAQLRQNPSEALRGVQNGDEYTITYHGRRIARMLPIATEHGVGRERAMSLYDTAVDAGWAEELRRTRGENELVDPW